MITYNEIYEASKRHLRVSFKLPRRTEQQFLVASGEIAIEASGVFE
jgi:hypothetical protein